MAAGVFSSGLAILVNSEITMNTRHSCLIHACLVLAVAVTGGMNPTAHAAAISDAAFRQNFLSLPLYFEPGATASASGFDFVARGQSRSVQLSSQRALLSLLRVERQTGERSALAAGGVVSGQSVGFEFLAANPHARLIGESPAAGQINYFLGNDPAGWRRHVPTFGRVRASDIYPGIDLVYYGNQEQLEYDFIVQPGATPDLIAFRVDGADALRLDAAGDLLLQVGNDCIRQHRPLAYQIINGARRAVPASYRLAGRVVTFDLGAYDRARPLVIDPILSYVTFFNGNKADVAWDLAFQSDGTNGYLLVAGETLSANLPATPGAFTNQLAGVSTVGGDAFVAKFDLNQTSSNLVFLTYLGGVSHDGALSIAADAAGNAYLTGYTASTNFPVVGSLRTNLNGGVRSTPTLQQVDGFVTKLSADGANLIYSAFLGGEGVDEGFGITVGLDGAAYVTGFTESTNFPSVNATSTNRYVTSDAFVAKVNPDGQTFAYSFPIGGIERDRGESVIVDAAGNAFVCGYTRSYDFPITTNTAFQTAPNQLTNQTALADAFLLKVNPTGAVTYATYLGGSRDDFAFNLTSDASGNIYVCGSTASTNFVKTATNVLSGVFTNSAIADGFVTKFDPSLTNVIYSLVFGGIAKDEVWDVAVDSQGRAVVVGDSFSLGLPVTNYFGFLSQTNSGNSDVFLGRLNAAGTGFEYLGYLGGSAGDLAYAVKLDDAGNVYFVGQTSSANFPGSPALAGTSDAFVAKVFEAPTLSVAASAGNVTLSWPAFAPEFQLQSLPALPATNNWQVVPGTPTIISGRHTLVLSPSNDAAFFRLRQP